MKLKSLLFGSAAILAAGTGAQAADLPVAEPVEYVRICDAFGTGFFYIPGTDTCLQISGRVRVESHYVDDGFGSDDDDGGGNNDDDDDGSSDNDFIDREFNNWTTRARANIRLDARTQTDFGLIRAFFNIQVTEGPSDFATSYSSSLDLSAAFITIANDWGTYTAGHTSSFFDFFGSNTFGTRVGIDDATVDTTLFAWTFAGGNGFSGTISVEDPLSSGRRINPSTNFFDFGAESDNLATGAFDDYEGQEAPDLVANIRVDQGWGSAQIMGMVGQIHDDEGFDNEDGLVGPPNERVIRFQREGEEDGDALRWAVGAGLNANLPFFGLGFNSQVSYSEGAVGYVSGDPISRGYFGGFNSGDFIGPDADETLTTAWSARAGISGDFTETWGFLIDGSYTEIDTDSDRINGRRRVVGGEGARDNVGVEIDGLDYDMWGVVGTVTYTPVSGLLFGWEVGYNRLEIDEQDGENTAELLGNDDDQDVIGAMFRVQRDF